MQFSFSALTQLPAELNLVSTLKFVGIFAFAVLFVGLLARVVIGKKSSLNHSISAAMGILCIYAVSIMVYTFNPYGLSRKRMGIFSPPVVIAAHQFDENSPELQQVLEAVRTYTKK